MNRTNLLRALTCLVIVAATAVGPLPKLGVFPVELLCLLALPWVIRDILASWIGVCVAALVVLAAVGFTIANLHAGNGLHPVVVPVARDLLLVATAAAVAWRAPRSAAVRLFLPAAFLGAAVYGLQRTTSDPPAANSIWKYGSGSPVFLFGVAALAGLRRRWSRAFMYVWMLSIAALSAWLGFRSLSLVAVASCALLFLFARRRRAVLTAAFGVVMAGAVAVAVLSYPTAADRGWLGHEAQATYRFEHAQSASRVASLGVLGVARSSTFTDAALVRESPLLGHGAHPTLSIDTALEATRWSDRFGIRQTTDELVQSWYLIAEHSLLFEAWVTGGLLAALLLIFLLLVLFPWLATRGWHRSTQAPVGVATACLGFWDVLFSPVAPSTMLSIAVAVGAAAAMSARSETWHRWRRRPAVRAEAPQDQHSDVLAT